MRTNALRLLGCLAMALCGDPLSAGDAAGLLERPALVKEPAYETAPKYSLIALGDDAKVKVWMIEDGKRLFVDKNANGDLTDDGPPIQPSDVRSLGSDGRDFAYQLAAILPLDGSLHTDFYLRCWQYNPEEKGYGLSLTVGGKLPMYAGWFGTFWSEKSETAPVIHLGGPFTPRLLRAHSFPVGGKLDRLSVGFLNEGSGKGTQSRVSIEALPKEVVPKIVIQWPVAEGAPPLRTEHLLTERCCYWEFYTTVFAVPAGAVAGKAEVSVELPERGIPFRLATKELGVKVVAPAKNDSAAR